MAQLYIGKSAVYIQASLQLIGRSLCLVFAVSPGFLQRDPHHSKHDRPARPLGLYLNLSGARADAISPIGSVVVEFPWCIGLVLRRIFSSADPGTVSKQIYSTPVSRCALHSCNPSELFC
jgi:hypothetical protein